MFRIIKSAGNLHSKVYRMCHSDINDRLLIKIFGYLLRKSYIADIKEENLRAGICYYSFHFPINNANNVLK